MPKAGITQLKPAVSCTVIRDCQFSLFCFYSVSRPSQRKSNWEICWLGHFMASYGPLQSLLSREIYRSAVKCQRRFCPPESYGFSFKNFVKINNSLPTKATTVLTPISVRCVYFSVFFFFTRLCYSLLRVSALHPPNKLYQRAAA